MPLELRELPPQDMAPDLDWDDFWSEIIASPEHGWKQNQHVGLVGPTEQGKTNLAYHLLELRDYVTYFAIKTQDETLDAFAAAGGYVRLTDWPPKRGLIVKREVKPAEMPRRLLWPDATELDSEAEQRRVFGAALRDIYARGGWCTVFDDYWYLASILGFEKDTKKFLMNARSNYSPMIICTQRPAGHRLVEMFDQTTHLFFFRDNDEPNLKRIGGVGYLSSDIIRGFVANLEQFQFLYVNTRTGWMYRSRAPRLEYDLAA
jgi:hypothetical protein